MRWEPHISPIWIFVRISIQKSRVWIWSTVFWVDSPERFHCATLILIMKSKNKKLLIFKNKWRENSNWSALKGQICHMIQFAGSNTEKNSSPNKKMFWIWRHFVCYNLRKPLTKSKQKGNFLWNMDKKVCERQRKFWQKLHTIGQIKFQTLKFAIFWVSLCLETWSWSLDFWKVNKDWGIFDLLFSLK